MIYFFKKTLDKQPICFYIHFVKKKGGDQRRAALITRRQGEKMERKYNNIIELAKSRGSSSTTAAGAKRYLLSKLSHSVFEYNYILNARGKDARIEYERQRLERRAKRILRASNLLSRDEAEQLADELNSALIAHTEHLIAKAYPYRRSSSRWAGGKHDVSVRLAPPGDCTINSVPGYSDNPNFQPTGPAALCETRTAWSNNGRWKGTNSVAKFYITLRALSYFPNPVVNGLVTLDALQIAPREYKILWCEQSRGVQLREVEGWYIKCRHVKAHSLAEARKKAASLRHAAAQSVWENRFSTRQARLDKKNFQDKLRKTFVEREDSIAAGNCSHATDEFARRAARALGAPQDPHSFALRADILLSLRDDSYARRAVQRAMQRLA